MLSYVAKRVIWMNCPSHFNIIMCLIWLMYLINYTGVRMVRPKINMECVSHLRNWKLSSKFTTLYMYAITQATGGRAKWERQILLLTYNHQLAIDLNKYLEAVLAYYSQKGATFVDSSIVAHTGDLSLYSPTPGGGQMFQNGVQIIASKQ